jgi:DNA invertase Pin-like site-specific DNA recombinase
VNAIIYSRVSTTDGTQTVENQLADLVRWEQAMGERVHVVERISDQQSSRDTRPGKERALKLLRTKQADTVVFWSLDRWGRTMSELVSEFDEAVRRDWTLISLKEGVSLDSAAGKLFANLLAAFAQFERDRLSERTRAGMARAKQCGTRSGRPIGRPRKAAA